MEELVNEENAKVLQHMDDLVSHGLDVDQLKAAAPAILHLGNSERTKRLAFSAWLRYESVNSDLRNKIFLQSLRRIEPDFVAMKKLATHLDSTVPELFAACCAAGNSAMKRVVEDANAVFVAMDALATRLSLTVAAVWETCDKAGGSVVKRVVEHALGFYDAMDALATGLSLTAAAMWATLTGSPNPVWIQCLDRPADTVVIILRTDLAPAVLLKLQPPAFGNCWTAPILREMALNAMSTGTSWPVVKQILQSPTLTSDNFQSRLSQLTPDNVSRVYEPREKPRIGENNQTADFQCVHLATRNIH
jgi:hypothetical protein